LCKSSKHKQNASSVRSLTPDDAVQVEEC